ncbi:MAG: hypothetical protein M5U18_11425 [Dehalococcoidia bacterium]|nr:hypothetical protein [Dehalococcoidia bacterium]
MPSLASKADDDLAVFALADAVGFEFGVFCEGDVHQAAFGGTHGLECDGAAGLADAVGHALGEGDDALFVAVAVVLDIDGDSALARVAAREEEVDEVLEGDEGIAPAADEEAEVLSLDVDDGEDTPEAIAGSDGLADRDLSVDVEDAKDVVDGLGGEIDLFGVDIRGNVFLGFPGFIARAAAFPFGALRARGTFRPWWRSG